VTDIPNKRYFRPDELARLIEEPVRTIYYWISKGYISCIQIGTAKRISRDEVLRLQREGYGVQLKPIRTTGLTGNLGFVYILKADNGLCKIGMCINLKQRLKQIDAAVPSILELFGFIETLESRNLEAKIHRRYSSKRVKGEWFNLEDESLLELQQYQGYKAIGLALGQFLRM
jgi:excisionase family DNA binding protein